MKEEPKSVQEKLGKVRGSSHPYVSLENAIKLSGDLKRAVGKGPFSREVAARGLNHESVSGPAAGKIAALVQFGLLLRKGNTYSISPLADRILLPVSDDDRVSAIAESAKRPKLYKQLVEKYQNQSLPFMLENILVREYGVYEKKSKEIVKNFKKSLEYAGLLNNGVVVDKTMLHSQNQPKQQGSSDFSFGEDLSGEQSPVSVNENNSKHEYSLRSGKKIIISYPADFTLEEARSIKSFAEYLLSMREKDS